MYVCEENLHTCSVVYNSLNALFYIFIIDSVQYQDTPVTSVLLLPTLISVTSPRAVRKRNPCP